MFAGRYACKPLSTACATNLLKPRLCFREELFLPRKNPGTLFSPTERLHGKGMLPRLRANGRNIVGCYILRPFAHLLHAVGCCCTKFETLRNNMQQGVQTDAACNIQQCWELLANNVASVCTGPYSVIEFYS